MVQTSAADIVSLRMVEQGSSPATPAATYQQIFVTTAGVFIVNSAGATVPVKTYKREIFIPAYQMWPSTTAGSSAVTKSEAATNDQNTQSLDFDQTTQEHAEFTLWMPDDWNAGTITYKVVWTAAAGTPAETVEWDLQARAYANDDAIDQAWGTAVEVSDALLAAGDIHYTSESAALTIAGTPAAGELVQFRVYRDVNDTLAADALLLGIKIYFT